MLDFVGKNICIICFILTQNLMVSDQYLSSHQFCIGLIFIFMIYIGMIFDENEMRIDRREHSESNM